MEDICSRSLSIHKQLMGKLDIECLVAAVPGGSDVLGSGCTGLAETARDICAVRL